MLISLIAAMGKNRVIGLDNKMMWHLPEEFKYFKQTTLGHCIITGRKNFEATGRALPGRTNIIVTRNRDYSAKDCIITHDLDEALNFARNKGESEVFICGGGQIYQESIAKADRIYLTYVDFEKEGEVYFPEFNEQLYDKKLIHQVDKNENNSYAWKAYIYSKK